MKNYILAILSIMFAVLATIALIYSFNTNSSSINDILGFGVNIWMDRVFWVVILIDRILSYIDRSKIRK